MRDSFPAKLNFKFRLSTSVNSGLLWMVSLFFFAGCGSSEQKNLNTYDVIALAQERTISHPEFGEEYLKYIQLTPDGRYVVALEYPYSESKGKSIFWFPWRNDSLSPPLITTLDTSIHLNFIRSFYATDTDSIYLYIDDQQPPFKVYLADRQGHLIRTIDLENSIQSVFEKPNFETIYATAQAPPQVINNSLFIGVLPFDPILSSANQSRMFLEVPLHPDKNMDGNFIPIFYPEGYLNREYQYIYHSPYLKALDSNRVLVAFQASPKIFIYNISDGSTQEYSLESKYLTLEKPPLIDSDEPQLAKPQFQNGYFGPIYYRPADGVFVRQVIVPDPADIKHQGSVERISSLIVFQINDQKNQIDKLAETEPIHGLNELGFFTGNNSSQDTLFILKSAEEDLPSSGSLGFDAFIVRKKEK